MPHVIIRTPIKLNRDDFRDRVYACWVGKNIGGTMGTPYEGTRDMLDVKGFVTKPNEVLPNDDLDLQLVWLYAVMRRGPQAVNAAMLGEYWTDFVVPYWNEYGIGKLNLQRGMLPPLSGDYHNNWRDSNGAWIRTEIWASLAPGNPDLAARYAMEDAMVDHGTGEGTVAAAFVAAMQSTAFVVHDLRVMIDVALSKIPAGSRTAKSVLAAMECYDAHVPVREAREKIRLMNADIGDGWFEAPSNVGYTVLGLLYGEGDFKKSMITAINCGDDTDCTGATVGATLGIMYGLKGIPEDWRQYIGDAIVTVSINLGTQTHFPETCTELTDLVVGQTPGMLLSYIRQDVDIDVSLTDGKSEIPENVAEIYKSLPFTEKRFNELKPFSFELSSGPVKVLATFEREPDIRPNESIGLHISVTDLFLSHGNIPLNLTMRWLTPEGFTVSGPQSLLVQQRTRHSTDATTGADYVITAGETVSPVNRLVLEIVIEGHAVIVYLPVIVMG